MNSTYSFGITDFRAIERADILLNGITVIAGINGSGKSTIARNVFSTINVLNDFDDIQKEYFIDAIMSYAQKICKVVPCGEQKWDKVWSPLYGGQLSVDGVSNIYHSFIRNSAQELRNLQWNNSNAFINRVYRFLIDEIPDGKGIDYLVEKYVEKSNTYYEEQYQLFQQRVANRSHSSFNIAIQNEYPDCETNIMYLHFAEDNVELIDENRFLCPLSLNRAIYIDTPMALNLDCPKSKTIWGRLHSLMFKKNDSVFQDKLALSKLIRQIKMIIGGNIITVKNFSQEELHYISNNGLDIAIEDAATGIKSFAYILRLLENGWLNERSLLIIDEPEAHLHPQWIVEFAKVLVLLQKELGVRILVASHDPDMIAAIHEMSQYYGLSKNTNFYIAEEKDESRRYDYRSLGNEIGDIFESFNVALVKIRDYSGEE